MSVPKIVFFFQTILHNVEIQFELSGKHEIVQSYAKKRPVKRKRVLTRERKKRQKFSLRGSVQKILSWLQI